MIKFLHAADLHLGSAFASLPPAVAKQRRAELLETATEIVELCNSSQCQLLLLAGDLCETAEAVRGLARLLAACSAEVVIAPGNHDPYGARAPTPGLPGRTTSASSTIPRSRACALRSCAATSTARPS